MINSAKDFNSALAYVQEDIDYTSAKLYGDMSSSTFNSIFLEIENHINVLYEKIRLLEDIRDYTKNFVICAIQERRTKIMENLKVIETLADEVYSTGNLTTAVIPDNRETLHDRDGAEISCLENNSNALVMPGTVLAEENNVSIINNGPVKEMITKVKDPFQGDYSAVENVSFADADPLMSRNILSQDNTAFVDSFRSQDPVKKNLQVQYDITFPGKIHSNYIALNPVNCKVVGVTLYDVNNIPLPVDISQRYFPEMRVTKASVIIECANYDRQVVDMPLSRSHDAFDSVIEGSDIYG